MVKTVTHINTSELRGGAAKFAWRLCQWQAQTGMDTKMIVGMKEGDAPSVAMLPQKKDLRRYHRCEQSGWPDYSLEGSHNLIYHEWVKSSDIVHLHNLHGNYFNPFSLLPLTQTKPIVWTLHDMQAFTGRCAFSFGCDRWMSGCGNCPDLNIVPSARKDTTAQLLKDKKYIYDHCQMHLVVPSKWLAEKVQSSILAKQRFSLIYHGIDTDIFQPGDKRYAKQKLGISPDTLVIGTVAYGGAFGDPRKGSLFTQQCMEKLRCMGRKFKFVNIGGLVSPERDQANDFIINTGYIMDENELAILYSALDIFLFPSMAETFGLVVVEAMSCGVPVITFDSGATAEIVARGSTGFLPQYMDQEDLFQCLLRLVDNEDIRSRFSQNSRQRAVELFDRRVMVDQYHSVYLEEAERFVPGKCRVSYASLPGIITESARFNNVMRASGITPENIPAPVPIDGHHINVLFMINGRNESDIEDTCQSIKNQTYTHVQLEFGTMEACNLQNSNAELVLILEAGYILPPKFIETLVASCYDGEDALCCGIKPVRRDGTIFYRPTLPPISIDEEQITVYGGNTHGMIFRRDFLLRNRERLIAGENIIIPQLGCIDGEYIETSISNHIRTLCASADGRFYIYGAGGHTADLLNNVDFYGFNIQGIIDKNDSLAGGQLHGYPIYSSQQVVWEDIDSILISSTSYEEAIYQELIRKIEPKRIIRIYGGYHSEIGAKQ